MPRRPPPEAAGCDPKDWVCLAVVGAPRGVKGALRLTCFNENPEQIASYGPLHAGPGGRALSLRVIAAPRPGQVVVEVEGVSDRDAAAALTNTRLYVPRSALPPPEEDEFYHHDLIGLAVHHVDGRRLGTVKEVENHGAGDILEVVAEDGRATFLLPFTREAVPTVDLAGGRIVAEPPPGLVDDPETRPPWRATVLTLYPEMFPGPLGASLPGKALEAGIWSLETVDIRGFARDKHRTVDDAPFGGGPGMVMRPDVLAAAIDATAAGGGDEALILLTPRGAPLTQARVREFAALRRLVLVCGRFEGVDERVIEARGLQEVSVGDYVLSGGEPAAVVLIDACVRLLPGVVGAPETLDEESFESGLLEYPHYTRPNPWEGREVPEVLLSGHHGMVRQWRQEQAERVTRQRRPDLWRRRGGSARDNDQESGP